MKKRYPSIKDISLLSPEMSSLFYSVDIKLTNGESTSFQIPPPVYIAKSEDYLTSAELPMEIIMNRAYRNGSNVRIDPSVKKSHFDPNSPYFWIVNLVSSINKLRGYKYEK
jgi:hypothetical protein